MKSSKVRCGELRVNGRFMFVLSVGRKMAEI